MGRGHQQFVYVDQPLLQSIPAIKQCLLRNERNDHHGPSVPSRIIHKCDFKKYAH